jgi:hypothetical protein
MLATLDGVKAVDRLIAGARGSPSHRRGLSPGVEFLVGLQLAARHDVVLGMPASARHDDRDRSWLASVAKLDIC